jgi:hypothetical protein
MRVIQKGKAYSRIQLSPDEIICIYFAMMTQIGHTLMARQRCDPDSATGKALASQLETELLLANEFEKLKEKINGPNIS